MEPPVPFGPFFSPRARAHLKDKYFLCLLTGVYPSYEVAFAAHKRNRFARDLPVEIERNVNGLGTCKVWLAVSKPYAKQKDAFEAMRRLAPWIGTGAAKVCRGVVR